MGNCPARPLGQSGGKASQIAEWNDLTRERATVFVLVRYYLPGYKSGGPIRSIANLVNHLGDEFDFRIVTSDRDAADARPYQGISPGVWTSVGKAHVYYAPPSERTFLGVARLVRPSDCDILYLNSFFDPVFTVGPLLAMRVGLLPKVPTVIAPRGEFSRGALALKSCKKRPYLFGAGVGRLFANVIWQASSGFEKEDIERIIGQHAKRIVVAPNMPPPPHGGISESGYQPASNGLRVVFLSRVTPMKNLDFALQVLARVRVPIIFDIYGPIGEAGYWERCRKLIDKVPANVRVQYLDSVQHDQVQSVLSQYDLFFLPTRGENFGHVIAEALLAGTPVLISNATPWKGLEQAGVGWNLPLASMDEFVLRIEQCAIVSPESYSAWRRRVQTHAASILSGDESKAAHRRLFSVEIGSVLESSVPRGSGSAPRSGSVTGRRWGFWGLRGQSKVVSRGPVRTRSSGAARATFNDAVEWHSRMAADFDLRYRTRDAFRERYLVWGRLIESYSRREGRVLDVGCGSGVLSFLAGKQNGEVVGIDGSREMLDLCHGEKERRGITNVAFIQLELEGLDFEPLGTFDLILCSSVLEYLEDLWGTLRKLRGALAPGGVLIFSVPNRDSLYRLLERWSFALTGRPGYYAHVRHLLRSDDASATLQEQGMDVLQTAYYAATPILSRVCRMLGKPRWADNLFVVACCNSSSKVGEGTTPPVHPALGGVGSRR